MGKEKEQVISNTRSAQSAAPTPEAISILQFRLSNCIYAVESIYIRFVYPIHTYTFLPCVPSFVLGLINVRRQILPLIDLRGLFELPILGATSYQKALILQKNEREFALMTDGILEVGSIALADIQKPLRPLPGIQQEFLMGVTPENVIVLDGSKLLLAKQLIVEEQV